jgi:hypothetical protein
MATEASTIAGLTGTDDYRRGIEAFFEKEPADFRGE